MRFCYTGELRVSDDVLANLWYAGSVLEMREVLDLCINWAQTHIHAGHIHLMEDHLVRCLLVFVQAMLTLSTSWLISTTSLTSRQQWIDTSSQTCRSLCVSQTL